MHFLRFLSHINFVHITFTLKDPDGQLEFQMEMFHEKAAVINCYVAGFTMS